jgi:dTDP-4-dehydrorhamnose 3,5-epimerase
MKITPTEIPDVLLIEPAVHRDGRGFFLETWHRDRYRAAGIGPDFVQDNHSRSTRGTLRGLHGQRQRPQGKLVRAVLGEIWDVAVDVRPGSATFGRYVACTLSAEQMNQLWVPPGLMHGFCVVSEVAEVEYKCTDLYDRNDEVGLRWDDAELAIPWPIRAPVLSEKDQRHPSLGELRRLLTP